MKSYKEQADELIERINNNKNYGVLDNFLINKEKIKTLIQAGEYFIELINVPIRCDENSFFRGIEEIEESLTKLKEAIK